MVAMSIKEHPPHHSVQQELTPGHHIPVLLDEVVRLLDPKPGESYLDLTAGYGGHASAILSKSGSAHGSVLVDRDDYAIERLSPLESKGAQLVHSDFLSAARQLVDENKRFDLILVDLGVSSPQLDQPERGFSFTNSGPLDMRMDRRQETSATTLVNEASAQELARIIHQYGEEPYRQAERYANAIVAARVEKPFETTKDLAEVISTQYRGRRGKTHPATRTFQAIRIAVNDELSQIEALLPLVPRLLTDGGRVAIISFHSLEDRLVKQFFKEQTENGYEAELQTLTKKPIDGSVSDVHNPRSRSAKLRVAVKK
jgi:16S rRNA (cytosine1402-N4)-methyltransferase